MRYVKKITRKMLQSEPETLFVFGDNMRRYGYGGQAKEMRDEPNAVGIPTKWSPADFEEAYFQDADLIKVMAEIDRELDKLYAHAALGGEIVWPEDGIGTGMAQLPERAPKIWEFIENARKDLAIVSRQ